MTSPPAIRCATPRLDLVAATLEHLSAELESPARLAALLGAEVEEGWPPGEYDREAQVFFRDRLTKGGDAVVGWLGWYAVRRATPDRRAVVVGAGGFLGPPDDEGAVEIGFSVVASWRGHGYASEMAEALVGVALADRRVVRIVAHTTEANAASCGVLRRAGLHRVGAGPEPGSLRFELVRPARPASRR
ncbi:MAG: GNAT family N-acetyltransferase [Acidobacteria bacterium]|nr:GNAT family N-acetyltransferase [Acidobacteriota bacterium]